MGKVVRAFVFLGAILSPATALPQEAEARTEVTDFEDGPDGRGIVEHEIVAAPSGTEQPAHVLDGDLPRRPEPKWPGEHLRDGWDYATPFAFAPVYPNIAARLSTAVGDVRSETHFLSRFEAELYLLRFGANFLESVGGERSDFTWADVDLRIPISLGRGHRLAIVPGLSFPIDERDKSEETTNVRLQGVWGWGGGGLGVQLMAGISEGSRNAGLLDVAERIDHTAALWGGLLAWRIAPPVQLRLEVAGELAAVAGAADRITVLPGAVFFPWSDPRLHLGLTAVVEAVGEDFDADATFGGLFDLGFYFY